MPNSEEQIYVLQSENSKIDNTASDLGETESKTESIIDPKDERLRDFVLLKLSDFSNCSQFHVKLPTNDGGRQNFDYRLEVNHHRV